MFYTKFGRGVAGLAFAIGGLMFLFGNTMMFVVEEATKEQIEMYQVFVGNGGTVMLFGLCLGVLTDISNTLADRTKS